MADREKKKRQKIEETELQKFEYLQNEKSFLGKIKKHFS